MAPHSSTLAWKIPWMEEPGRLQSWDCEESDMTERLHFHFSLSCIGEGNGNPLQCSCLENPRDGGAWWAAVCGVAQRWTQLKWLSSSSSSSQRNLEKEEWNWRNQPVWLQALLQSYSHQDSMVLAQKQKYRSVEQNRKPRDKSMHLWTPYLWQKRQEYTIEKKQSLQQVVLGKLVNHL